MSKKMSKLKCYKDPCIRSLLSHDRRCSTCRHVRGWSQRTRAASRVAHCAEVEESNMTDRLANRLHTAIDTMHQELADVSAHARRLENYLRRAHNSEETKAAVYELEGLAADKVFDALKFVLAHDHHSGQARQLTRDKQQCVLCMEPMHLLKMRCCEWLCCVCCAAGHLIGKCYNVGEGFQSAARCPGCRKPWQPLGYNEPLDYVSPHVSI